MVQIIEENIRRPRDDSLQNFSNSIANYLSERSQSEKMGSMLREENEALQRLTGQDFSGIQNPKFKELLLSDSMKGPNEKEMKYFQEQENLSSALDRVGTMRSLRRKGNLGRGSSIKGFFGGDTARDIGEYETLGNSLIQYASSIPIRNRLEFEKLAGRISDPSITDKEAEGILEGLEKIIKSSLVGESKSQQKPRRSLQEFVNG